MIKNRKLGPAWKPLSGARSSGEGVRDWTGLVLGVWVGVHLRVVASDSSSDVARASRPWVWSGMGVPPMFWRRFRLRQAYGGQVAPSMGGTPMPLPPPSTRRCTLWVLAFGIFRR